MAKPVVFVIGATGNIGTATIANLSHKFADKVEIRAGVRNPDKADKLKAIPNVTVEQATMGDSSLVNVLQGVSTLYIVTPPTENRADLAVATAEYAKQAGVKHIAVVSVPTAELPETIFGRQCNKIEDKISKLGTPYTIIRLPFFVDNYLTFKPTIITQGVLYGSIDPDSAFNSATVEDIGKASAAILASPEKFSNQVLTILSGCHSYNDFVKELSAALGKEVKYVRIPYEVAEKNMAQFAAEWQAKGVTELSKLIDSKSPIVVGGDLGAFKRITGEEPNTLKQWVTKNSGAFSQ